MHEGRYQRARAAARPGVARALRRATPARTARAAFVVGAILALAWATSLALPAGLAPLASPAPAAAATEVALSLGSARVAGGSGQVHVVLGVDNPRPAFPGWVEIRGVERRTISAVEVPAGASELRVWASPGDSGGGLSVRLLDSSERPVSSSQDLVLDYSASVLVVGARSADYAFLADVLGMSVERSASFPNDPREYGLYAAVVLAEPEREALARSAGPLLDWTKQGGLLVWAAGEEAKPTESDEVADIFPASPAERSAVGDATPILVSVRGSEPVSLAQPGLEAGREVTILTPTEEESDLAYSVDDGSVIMVAAPEGLGRSAVAGLLPTGQAGDDAADTGLSQFWQSLLSGVGPPVPAATTSEGAAPHGFVTGRVPSPWLTMGLALVYVGVVGVGVFVWLRRLRRRDAVWWALPLVVVVCTAGVLAAGLALRGPNARVVTRLNVVAPPEGTLPVAYRAVGVYAPFGADVGLSLPEGAFPGPTPTGGLPGLEGVYTVRQQADDTRFEGVGVPPGSGRTVIYGDSAGPDADGTAWPWQLTARQGDDNVTWTVTNTSERELRRVTLLADGLWSLPDLPPGGAVGFTLRAGRVTAGEAERMTAQPQPADTDDLVEWDASRRLRDEWSTWGGPEAAIAPVAGPGGSVGVEVMVAPVASPTEVRVLAWADDDESAVAVEGIPGDSAVQGIVVFEAVLR